MPRPILNPRKKRTRDHVIADLSVNHLERFILEGGHTTQVWFHDYGYDLSMTTYDENGQVEPGPAHFQLKASESLSASSRGFSFDIDVRDYNLWQSERMPVYLILHDAGKKRAYWLDVQRYFGEDDKRRPKAGAKTIRVYLPESQVVNARAIVAMRQRKLQAYHRYDEETPCRT
jgi:hypothetical protein